MPADHRTRRADDVESIKGVSIIDVEERSKSIKIVTNL
jgi:hypothetical protein